MKPLPLILLLLSGLGKIVAAEAPASVAELFVTPENLKLVRQANNVDACILRHIEPAVRANGSVDWSTERYEETDFAPVPAETAQALRELLLSGQTYDWKSSRGGRRPQFQLRLRFHRANEIVAIDFCFPCHVLSLAHQGEELGHANFGRNGDLFLQVLRKIFPEDAALRQAAREAGLPL